MQGAVAKISILTFAIVLPLTIVACDGGTVTPTSPTVAAVPVAATAPTPEPTPAAPAVPDEGAPITVRGTINRMSRSGATGIDVYFRIDSDPWIRGDAATVVINGSASGDTTYLRDQQTVTIDGRRRGDYVYAKKVIVDTNP
jgi:hypothetical protein